MTLTGTPAISAQTVDGRLVPVAPGDARGLVIAGLRQPGEMAWWFIGVPLSRVHLTR